MNNLDKKRLTDETNPTKTLDVSLRSGEEQAYALFAVANEYYAIDLDAIFEILHDFTIVPATHLPDIYAGIVRLRNETIPVVHLRRLLNLPAEEINYPVCLILQSSGQKIGYLIDSDIEIIKSSECQFFPLPDSFTSQEQKFLEGIISYKDRLFGIIKLDMALKTLTERR
ncbi:MAG: chemotaxis protein CheW [candidate division WOR-3 bacterium]